MFKVKKKTLLSTAGILWLISGVNILRIGVSAFVQSMMAGSSIWLISLGAVLVFTGFMMMFRKIVRKHEKRILSYPQERREIWHCFDRRGYLLMIFMMTLGIVLRRFAQLPAAFFAVFYSGLGCALSMAGLLFMRVALANHKKTDRMSE